MEENLEGYSLAIKHNTRYRFSRPVYLEPHSLFFQPCPTSYYTLVSHRLEVSPEPAGNFTFSGGEGNIGNMSWFSGTHQELLIRAESILRVRPHNPFGFLIYPSSFCHFPFTYPPDLERTLAPSLVQNDPPDTEVRKYAALIASQTDSAAENRRDTLSLLWECTRSINRDFSLVERTSGPPWKASETYAKQEGSCRDLAYLQICLFRFWRIAARFVSGYLYLENPDEEPAFELHGWVEVYIPGGGWIGLDPSHGIFCDHNYVPVRQSPLHSQTLPVNGFIRGSASSELTTELTIEKTGQS